MPSATAKLLKSAMPLLSEKLSTSVSKSTVIKPLVVALSAVMVRVTLFSVQSVSEPTPISSIGILLTVATGSALTWTALREPPAGAASASTCWSFWVLSALETEAKVISTDCAAAANSSWETETASIFMVPVAGRELLDSALLFTE